MISRMVYLLMPRRSVLSALALALLFGCKGASSHDPTPVADEPPARDATPRKPVEPPKPIDLSDYDRSCTSDEDCLLVEPQPCAKCGCASAPIAKREEARFRSTMANVRCPSGDLWPDVVCGSCLQMTAWCDAGECKAR